MRTGQTSPVKPHKAARAKIKTGTTTTIHAQSCASRTLHGMTIWTRSGFVEGGHQLEKLEFALALAEARGDQRRCRQLRDRIADLGGNAEEPGT